MSDEFFEDEVEAMEAAAGAPSEPTPASPGAEVASGEDPARAAASDDPAPAASDDPAPARGASADAGYVRTPPPFWMVLAIAAISLLLGVVIGYLAGSASALQTISEEQAAAQAAQAEDASSFAMPEGHPEVSVDEDGTAHVTEPTE